MGKFKRRGNGMGTVYKLSGNRRAPFVAMAPAMEDVDGNVKRQVIGYFATQREAEDALSAFRSVPAPVVPSLTFEGLYEQWKVQGYKNTSKSAYYAYTAAWAKFSPIYKYKVRDVKTPQLQFCVDRVAETGASKSSLNNMIIVAGKLFKFAMQFDLVNKNYAEFVVLPKMKKTEKAVFTDFQIRKLEEGARDGVGVASHILVMCFTGWRIQEYLNLTVFDFDREARTLSGGLKTEAGVRTVPVPDRVLPFVTAAFEKGERLCPMNDDTFREKFYKTLDALEIQSEDVHRLTPHSTRHTFNSMLANAGVDVDTRMRLMGQKDAKTNINVYTHFELETLHKAVSNL